MSASTPSVDLGLRFAFQSLHADEVALAAHFIHLGEQYPSEHEIHHVARDLLTWSRDNIAQIQMLAQQYRLGLGPDSTDTALSTCPSPSSVPAGRHPAPADTQPPSGLRLLDDLRTAYLLAAATSLSWELLAQLAQARHESDILELTARCHPRTLRQMRWANTMLKTQSPQALTTL